MDEDIQALIDKANGNKNEKDEKSLEIETLFDTADEVGVGDEEFVISLRNFYEERGFLTDKQIQGLENYINAHEQYQDQYGWD